MVKRMTEQNSAPDTSFYLGFDGGGTKTDCILMDVDANVLERHHLKASDIRGICAGIGGAGRESVAKRIATFLERAFPESAVTVTTDLAITLNAAVGEGEGIILVVGTGSAAYGRDAQGHTARAGGRGPWFSDEGSAFDIGRRAMAAVVRAEESRGPQTALSGKMLTWLGCNDWTRVMDWVIKNPDDVFPRVFPLVAELGDKGDSVSCEILTGAADSLAQLAASVIQKLDMQNRDIVIAKSGGTLGRSKFFDAAIDSNLAGLAPRAQIIAMQMKPAEAAARIAIHLGKRKGHAG